MTAVRIERAARRRGAFGLDERRWPDPARIEDDVRRFLAGHLPEIWALPPGAGRVGGDGRTLTLLLPNGHAAVLSIARDSGAPGGPALALAERCRAMRIPHATVSSLAEGRAALRRFGLEPRPQLPPRPTRAAMPGAR